MSRVQKTVSSLGDRWTGPVTRIAMSVCFVHRAALPTFPYTVQWILRHYRVGSRRRNVLSKYALRPVRRQRAKLRGRVLSPVAESGPLALRNQTAILCVPSSVSLITSREIAKGMSIVTYVDLLVQAVGAVSGSTVL